MADAAVTTADRLARTAEWFAQSDDQRAKTAPYATVGALWADIAGTHAAIAAALPDTTVEDTADTNEEN